MVVVVTNYINNISNKNNSDKNDNDDYVDNYCDSLTMQRKQMLSAHAPQQPRKLKMATQLPTAMMTAGTLSKVMRGLAGSVRRTSK